MVKDREEEGGRGKQGAREGRGSKRRNIEDGFSIKEVLNLCFLDEFPVRPDDRAHFLLQHVVTSGMLLFIILRRGLAIPLSPHRTTFYINNTTDEEKKSYRSKKDLKEDLKEDSKKPKKG